MNSRYFKSKKLKPLSERPEHIRLDGEVVIEGFKNQLFDFIGRATDKQIQEICNVFEAARMRGGKVNGRQTVVDRMIICSIKEMKREGRFVNE